MLRRSNKISDVKDLLEQGSHGPMKEGFDWNKRVWGRVIPWEPGLEALVAQKKRVLRGISNMLNCSKGIEQTEYIEIKGLNGARGQW